ncbi:MAG: hypothetical protein NTY81_02895 [Candidatus Staskawiczbacteria bacterium]|nr:hypothetical protein [Candidatus Staskawiczbacteria bacterium]
MGERYVSFKKWQKDMMGQRREQTLTAIKSLVRVIFLDEDLTEHRIGQQLVEIARAITEFGVTDEMIAQAISEAKQEVGFQPDEDGDEISESFGKILPFITSSRHKTDGAPELRALRSKHASHIAGGHALARKIAEQ